jgi:hypothetical protein
MDKRRARGMRFYRKFVQQCDLNDARANILLANAAERQAYQDYDDLKNSYPNYAFPRDAAWEKHNRKVGSAHTRWTKTIEQLDKAEQKLLQL